MQTVRENTDRYVVKQAATVSDHDTCLRLQYFGREQ